MDDWEWLDDWSETEDWDSSDEWDAADDAPHGWAVEDDEEEDEEEVDGVDAHGTGYARGAGGRRMIDAWDFGTGAAVAGWLLDRQAEQIVEGVRAAAARAPAQAPAAGHDRAARPRVPGPPVDWDATPLHVGDPLERSRLAVTIAVRLGANRPLGLDAAPATSATRAAPAGPAGRVRERPGLDRSALSFTVAVTRIVPDLPVWVMFDDRPGGFRAAELRSTFADDGPAGRAYRFVATAEEAVEVVEWGLGRYGLGLPDFRWVGGF